jgi:fluoride exporter
MASGGANPCGLTMHQVPGRQAVWLPAPKAVGLALNRGVWPPTVPTSWVGGCVRTKANRRTAAPERRPAVVLRERWDILVVIAIGGSLGSVGRWGVGELLPHGSDAIAWSTMIENVSGALFLGVLMVFVLEAWPTTRLIRPFLGVGVLGGYTTFSTYMLDTRALLAAERFAAAAGYLFGTLAAGLVAVWVGIVLARSLIAARRRSFTRGSYIEGS